MTESRNPRPRVIIRHCESYDPERIRTLVREGMEALDLRPRGRTLVKPNLVATGDLFRHAFTRPEFMEGVLRALQDRDSGDMSELAVGERCGITVPTRAAYSGADYLPMMRRVGVKHYCFEEEKQVEIPLHHPERLRDYLFTPEPIARADFFVNCPKFKAHPWTTVTFSIKAYIGIQDDRHRLIDHDHRLDEKIADLQHIIQPQFIVIDGIIAGEGRMLTPKPFPLNLVIMGNNQVAFDTVCAAIIGVDARDVPHIRLAHEHGFGPIELSEIDVEGDVTLADAKQRAVGFQVGLVRVEKYFEGTHITAYAGPPPEREATDYCWGGCPGALEEAIEILRLYDKECDEKMARLHVVFGAYDGPLDVKPGEQVVFIGDCASWSGQLGEQLVQVESVYKDRATKDPYYAEHADIYAKMLQVAGTLREGKKHPFVRMPGCPVSVAEQVLLLVKMGGLKNPYFDTREVTRFNRGYLGWRSKTLLDRMLGRPYQEAGPCERGAAMPAGEAATHPAAEAGPPAPDAE